MAKLIKTVVTEAVHTIEVTNKELGYITKLLGQCRANGPTGYLYNALTDIHEGSLPIILNEQQLQPIRFE